MKSIIPVAHCFDNNYVIPAAVSFLSMLENASKGHSYELYVFHADITDENQQKLQDIVARFDNASLIFVNIASQLPLLEIPKIEGSHYTNEMYFKLLLPSLLPQYDKVLITDVDVVFCGDISRDFTAFDTSSSDYVAGVSYKDIPSKSLQHFWNKATQYQKDNFYSQQEKFLIGAGYLIFNLAKMRADNIEKKFMQCLFDNTGKLKQPEQDVINLCCFPHIKLLPLSSMICTYLYDIMEENEIEDLKEAIEPSIQIHYATHIKPWNTPTCTFAREWFAYLAKTPFFYDYISSIAPLLKDRKVTFTVAGIPIVTYRKSRTRESVKLFSLFSIKKHT